MSTKAKKAISRKIRDWHLKRRSGTDLSLLAEDVNPQVRGWINYYGAYYRSELLFLTARIDWHLHRWAMHRFKRLRGRSGRAWLWLHGIRQRQPGLFAHWQLASPTRGRTVGAG